MDFQTQSPALVWRRTISGSKAYTNRANTPTPLGAPFHNPPPLSAAGLQLPSPCPADSTFPQPFCRNCFLCWARKTLSPKKNDAESRKNADNLFFHTLFLCKFDFCAATWAKKVLVCFNICRMLQTFFLPDGFASSTTTCPWYLGVFGNIRGSMTRVLVMGPVQQHSRHPSQSHDKTPDQLQQHTAEEPPCGN